MKKIEIIKYHNDLQSVNISHLTLQESKIFIKLIQEVQNKQDEILNIKFHDFKNILANNITNENLIKLIYNTIKKTISSYIAITNNKTKELTIFTFFTEFQIKSEEEIVVAQVNSKFLYLINKLIKNYSTLLLSEAISFKSKYSLLMYKKVREFYNKERLEWNFDTFKEYLNIKSQPIRYVNDNVISAINKELPKIFKNFHIEKIKYKRKIIKILFTWSYERTSDKIDNLIN